MPAVYCSASASDRESIATLAHMDGDSPTREQQLEFFAVLNASSSRIAVIDALKAAGRPVTQPELANLLIATRQLAPQAKVNLERTHLDALCQAGLVDRTMDRAGVVWYAPGAALANGIHWRDVDPADEELASAATEFERHRTESRVTKLEVWSLTRWTDYPPEWAAAAMSRDNVVRCTITELERLEERLASLLAQWDREVDDRRAQSGPAGERPCFRTVAVFPWGPAEEGE